MPNSSQWSWWYVCEFSSNEETVLSTITTMMFLMTPSSKPGNHHSAIISETKHRLCGTFCLYQETSNASPRLILEQVEHVT